MTSKNRPGNFGDARGAGVTRHLRIFEPHPGLFAYYDGRIPGYRFMAEENWVDEGAMSLGIASYALVSGARALVYDTHVSVPHGQAIRAHLMGLGVTDVTVIYSHWHLDHVAGTAAFPGATVIANTRSAALLAEHRAKIEAGTLGGLPAIASLVLPDTTFHDRMSFEFGGECVELIKANIHSDDATLLWLPDRGVLLAGDTVEDTVTYVDAPEDFAIHLSELDRMADLGATHILPNHGAPERIAGGGYGPGLIAATARYIRWLMNQAEEDTTPPLAEILAGDLASGDLIWWAGYEAVHLQNLVSTRKTQRK